MNGYELVTSDGTKLSEFDKRYNEVTSNMLDLCIMASKLDNFNHKVFKEYVTDVMGLSISTVSVMIKAGKMYLEHEELNNIPYTKVYELQPVNEQLDNFVSENGGYDTIPTYSQKELRKRVKDYIESANNQIDETESNEQETIEQETNEPEEIDHTPTIEEQEFHFAICVLSEFSEDDIIDREDVKSLGYIIKCLKNHIRKEVEFDECQ